MTNRQGPCTAKPAGGMHDELLLQKGNTPDKNEHYVTFSHAECTFRGDHL